MALRWLLGLSLLIHGCGIWWGLRLGWAPDEITPGILNEAVVARFSGGWFNAYGPVQIYIIALFYLPLHILSSLSVIDQNAAFWHGAIWLLIRLVTLGMASATVAAVYVLVRDLWGRTAAIFATLIGTSMLTFVFYAKLGNVDAPYALWVVLSLFPYRRILLGQATIGRYVQFAAFAALAVATKDQAYAFFVFPALHIAWVTLRQRGAAGLAPLAAGAAAGIAVFLLLYNVVFNVDGMRTHFHMIATVSVDHRLYAGDLAGSVKLAGRTLQMTAWMMNWVGLAAAAAGIWMVATRRAARHLWLLVPVASYYLVLIAPIGYIYDRYLIAFGWILAMFAGPALAAAWARGRTWQAIALVVVAFSIARGASIDLLMLNDSRYAAVDWLHRHVSPDQQIGLIGFKAYLPPIAHPRLIHGNDSLPDPSARPDFIVVNPQFLRRPGAGREWIHEALRSGAWGYARRQVVKSNVPLAIVWHENTFRDMDEDWFTNLDKVNPRIEIYQRSR